MENESRKMNRRSVSAQIRAYSTEVWTRLCLWHSGLKLVGFICVWIRATLNRRKHERLHCWPSGFIPIVSGMDEAAASRESSCDAVVIVVRTIAECSTRIHKAIITKRLEFGYTYIIVHNTGIISNSNKFFLNSKRRQIFHCIFALL